MVNITFPDGNIKAFENALSGIDAAKSISDGFARNCVAMELDDNLVDLSTVIDHDANIRFVTTKDPDSLDILRHSAAHVMAQAILRLNKNAKLTIGPAVENQFYYDIDMDPISEDDFPKIEAEMKKIIKEKKLSADEIIYVGNDLNDVDCFPLVGFAVVPVDAYDPVKQRADLVLSRKGGFGAVRELCEMLISRG